MGDTFKYFLFHFKGDMTNIAFAITVIFSASFCNAQYNKISTVETVFDNISSRVFREPGIFWLRLPGFQNFRLWLKSNK